MKFVFKFDENKVEELGSTVEKVHSIIKDEFEKQSLVCLVNGETLEFGDVGTDRDYGKMWVIVFNLVKTNWFCKCATECTYYEEDDDEYGEDVLAQADMIRKSMED